MPAEISARAALRAATAPDHDRVDAAFARAALDDRAAYGAFLRAQAAAHLPTEAALDAAGIGAVAIDWPTRQRADLLRADLMALGLDVPADAGTVDLHGEAAMLGALYVLEGSRLGGTLLRRSVAPGLPASFLGNMDSAAWRSLLDLLDARLDTEAKRSIAIAAARDVFALFELAARLHLGNDRG